MSSSSAIPYDSIYEETCNELYDDEFGDNESLTSIETNATN
ncbi:14461_t:CDS:2, partial [Gigaspora rosea]